MNGVSETSDQQQVLFHHYPQSPVSEKVRIAFGIKNLSWRSVVIPRIPPKPQLDKLTGGYRRTPVMQVGADVFCDSLCILQALELLKPEPTLFPDGIQNWAISRWTDETFFSTAVAVVLGAGVDELPADFAADRGRLYFGPDYDLHRLKANLNHLVSQLRTNFHMMQRWLGNRNYMHGDNPGLSDALCYYLVWFIRGRFDNGPRLLEEFPRLEQWETRLRTLGHGQATEFSAEAALESAAGSEPVTETDIDICNPECFEAGMDVSVVPAGDGGDPHVHGRLVVLNADRIAILRQHSEIGEVVVHFPRLGYRIEKT